MINRKCNCENEVSRRKLAVLKTASSEKVALAKMYNCFEKVEILKVGFSPSKKFCVICLIESSLKMMKNAFYFILKALFVLKIFKFLSRLFGHVVKTA